ncbi:hypothetical protein [Polaromonas sp. UC242_47]|uniref:hypothetical protein n=1 Tax=Polaromonas sp. UC242_47 TaxID=3374626 RepID=UPI0037C6D1DE
MPVQEGLGASTDLTYIEPMNSTLSSCLRCAMLALLVGALAVPGMARAADEAGQDTQKISYKFTTGLYRQTGGGLPPGQGLDVNLRASSDFGNAWVGRFRSPALDVSQTRAGWDRTFRLGPVRFIPSIQLASGGFWGGSASLEAGSTWFAGLGLGRTNLRNYVNLNFDPNDAWMLSGGYRWSDSHSLALQMVRDNRLNPDQQHVHLVYRMPMANDQRLTLDLLSKRGLVEGVPIHRMGLSVSYDWPTYFVHLAWDPKVNFTPQDMLRLSAGMRF